MNYKIPCLSPITKRWHWAICPTAQYAQIRTVSLKAIHRGLQASFKPRRRLKPLPPNLFDNLPSSTATTRGAQKLNPKLRPDPYPEALVSSTSFFPPVTPEERHLHQHGVDSIDDDLLPPLPEIQAGVKKPRVAQSPRLDRADPNRRATTLAPPPFFDTRRCIPKVNETTEFIFGSSVVECALRSGKRKLYRLYIYSGENRTPVAKARDAALKSIARKLHPNLEIIDEPDVGQLHSMSNSRPHNGYVLECDPIAKIPVLSLGPVSKDRSIFGVNIVQHTAEQDIILNKLPRTIPCRGTARYPFIVMLDEILDPGNLGAIIRSVYYLGGDGLAISSRNCAPLSPIALKAACGSTEYLPLFVHTSPLRFIKSSQENGWRFYAAVPPASRKIPSTSASASGSLAASPAHRKTLNHILETEIGNPLQSHPCVLILGQEGEGLRSYVSNKANYKVSISRAMGTDRLVDSLNVSVACGLLCSRFLQPSESGTRKMDLSKVGDEARPEGEARPENEVRPENEAGPEDEAWSEDEAWLEDEAKLTEEERCDNSESREQIIEDEEQEKLF